jgi:hypothetical protein
LKQQSHRLVDLARALAKQGSSTNAQQDSIYTVEPLTVQTVELPAPIKHANAGAYPAGGIVTDTFYAGFAQSRTGIQALSQILSNQVLDSGLWHIKGSVSFQWIAGVSTAVAGASVGLQDPDGFTLVLAAHSRVVLQGAQIVPVELVVSLDRTGPGLVNPGWRFINQVDATLAADTEWCRYDFLCNRLI